MAANFALRDLREAATKLLHRVTIEREDSIVANELGELSLRNLMGPSMAWSHACRGILIEFFEYSWRKVFKANNRNIRSGSDEEWISDLEDLIEAENYTLRPSLWMSPFNGGGEQWPQFAGNDVVRYQRLVKFFQLLCGEKVELYEETKSMMENNGDMFHFLLEYSERPVVFRLKNISHAADAESNNPEAEQSQKKLKSDLRKLLQHEKFDEQVTNVSKLMMLMHILTDWNNLSTQGFDGLHDCLKKELELYHTDISDSANISRTKGLLRRIEAMKWGPNNFVRDESVMREAQERMERFGVLTLTGVGAVGKTALASKLLAVSAKDDKFDRYITMSTKVNSDQGELDPDSQGITETNSGNSLFTTLLNSENKRISGSMNRLCRAIIRAVKTDYRYQGEGTETLIESAISTMKNNSMLIVIDNFEDIEAPSEHLAKTEEGKKLLSDVNREFKFFQDYFKKWSVEYKGLQDRSRVGQKSITQVIITTRGKGSAQQNHPMPVPPLSINENYDLFEAKIQARFRDKLVAQPVLSAVRTQRDNIIKAFGEWKIPDNPENPVGSEYVHQPAYTIFAAAGIKEVEGSAGIFEQIKKWDPQGKSAELIRKYVTSKIFGGLNRTEIAVMGTLLGEGMDSTFDTNDIRRAVTDADLGEEWDFDTANNFLRDFSQHRDFFTETAVHSYKWNRFYFWEVRDHFKESYPDQYKGIIESKKEERYHIEEEKKAVIKRDERELLQVYLSHDNLDVPLQRNTSFNQVIRELKKEENLGDRDAAQSLLMLIGNGRLKASEDAVNSIFPARPPSTNLFDKFKSAKRSAPKGSTSKTSNQIVRTGDGKFVDDNFHHVWDYFCSIRNEIVNILKKCGEYTLIIRFYRILHSEAESLRENELISGENQLEFFKVALKHFNDVSGNPAAVFEKDLFDDISGIILNSYLESLSVVPRELREDFVSDQAEIIHYDTILEFVNRNIELTGTQEPLLGPLYWLALRRVASESKNSMVENHSLLAKIDEWLAHGAKCVSSVLSPSVVRQKKEGVLKNFKQVIWTIEELVNQANQRLGGLSGKLVYHKYGEKINCDQEILIPRGSPSDAESYIGQDVINQLATKHYPYRIGVINSSYIYLEPVIVDGKPMESNDNLIELESCREEIRNHHRRNRSKLNKLILWEDHKKTIPYIGVFPDFEAKKVKGQIEFYISIIGDTDKPLNYSVIQGKYYVKCGKISPSEKDGVLTYSYEERFDQSVLNHITKKFKKGGLSLPRNPNDLVRLVRSILRNSGGDKHVTYEQMIGLLEADETEDHIRFQTVYRVFRSLKVRDSNWLKRAISAQELGDIETICHSIRGQVWFIAKKRIEEGVLPSKVSDAVFEYFSSAQKAL